MLFQLSEFWQKKNLIESFEFYRQFSVNLQIENNKKTFSHKKARYVKHWELPYDVTLEGKFFWLSVLLLR